MRYLTFETWTRYFSSPFHILDATVIVAGLTIDIWLHGVQAEVASLVVILRLWRVLKIIEEYAAVPPNLP